MHFTVNVFDCRATCLTNRVTESKLSAMVINANNAGSRPTVPTAHPPVATEDAPRAPPDRRLRAMPYFARKLLHTKQLDHAVEFTVPKLCVEFTPSGTHPHMRHGMVSDFRKRRAVRQENSDRTCQIKPSGMGGCLFEDQHWFDLVSATACVGRVHLVGVVE